MGYSIECRDLYKSYGKTEALKNINLCIEENKIYGLLGRNGAGKTTLLNLIGCQIGRSHGDIKAFGEEVFENSKALEKICLVKEKGIPLEDERVRDIFRAAGILYPNWDEEYKTFLVKEFNLDIRKKYKNLSRGMKSIVGLIIGLSSRAEITIFDEPALGLDAAARDRFYQILLQDYEENKRTVILSTHLIDEASSIFEEIIILKDGEVKLQEDTSKLLERARFISGREERLLPLLKDKKIIHRESFGATAILGILGELSSEEMEALRDNNADISPMPLQKLFIYLTEMDKDQGV